MPRKVFSRNLPGRRTVAQRDQLEILLVDQVPVRAALASECTAAMARLQRARTGWHQFERQDKPAFIRWRAREFGVLLSTARDVEDKIRDAQTLIHQVEMEMRRHFQDPHTAYQRVIFRTETGVANEEEEEHDAGSVSNDAGETPASTGSKVEAGTARRLTEFEKEALFQEWVQKFMGTNPDKMDDEAYTSTFEVFKTHMFGATRTTAASGVGSSTRTASCAERRRVNDEPTHDGASETVAIDPRVKELYRRLVRRLHPDSRGRSANGTAAVSTLWHEVQEAYAASDVARMELLLALSDLSDDFGAGTTLSEMQSVLKELNRSVRNLEKMQREVQGEEAWNFARTGPSDDLRVRVERQLKHSLGARQERLELLTRTIANWAHGPRANANFRPARQRQFA